jgi:hypothetical protein
MWSSALTAILALLAGLTLFSGLVRVVIQLRRISNRLATIRLLLQAIALRTEPVDGFVTGIGANVAAIGQSVTLLEQASRRRGTPSPNGRPSDLLYPSPGER